MSTVALGGGEGSPTVMRAGGRSGSALPGTRPSDMDSKGRAARVVTASKASYVKHGIIVVFHANGLRWLLLLLVLRLRRIQSFSLCTVKQFAFL